MKTALKVVGVLTVIGGVVLGFVYASPFWKYEAGIAFLILVACIIGGLVASLIYFALYALLEKSDNIEAGIYRLQNDISMIKNKISNIENPAAEKTHNSTNANTKPVYSFSKAGEERIPDNEDKKEFTKTENPAKEKTLADHLQYAMRYTTEDGARNYLFRMLSGGNEKEREILSRLLATPNGQLNAAIEQVISEL